MDDLRQQVIILETGWVIAIVHDENAIGIKAAHMDTLPAEAGDAIDVVLMEARSLYYVNRDMQQQTEDDDYYVDVTSDDVEDDEPPF